MKTSHGRLDKYSEYDWEAPEKDKLIVRPLKRGKGKNLDDNLKRLPADYVTDDIDDPDRVHEIDPSHVRETVAADRHKEDVLGIEKEVIPTGPPKWMPVTQGLVDIIILKIKRQLLASAKRQWEQFGACDLDVRHIWFPENDIRIYEMRFGNPPARCERPKHLKTLDLVIDPVTTPQRVLDRIKKDKKLKDKFMSTFIGVE